MLTPVGKFPKLNKDPIVKVGVDNFRLRFTCQIDAKDTGDDVRHEVIWYGGPPSQELDRKVLTRSVVKGGVTKAYLQNTNEYGEKPTFCLNQNVNKQFCSTTERVFLNGLTVSNIMYSCPNNLFLHHINLLYGN